MRKNIYLILAILGFVIPYYFLVRFLIEQGSYIPLFNIPLLVSQLFVNDISAFFAVDLIISTIVFWVWLVAETGRLQMNNSWVYILASLTVGLSFALPLFLYFREDRLQPVEG
jgi:hypothetical protein